MESTLLNILANTQSIQLIALLAAALFFTAMAIDELSHERLEGLLFAVLSVFFIGAHFYFLINLPEGSLLLTIVTELQIWRWITTFLAPALIILFLSLGIWSIVLRQRQAALVKLFFGLTLLCFVFMIGYKWQIDARGIITLLFGLTWVNVEIAATSE